MANVERIPFVFNNNITTIETLKLEDGRLFFNASELWQMNGSPRVYSVEAYIKNDQTKELMLYCYLKSQKIDSIRDIIKQIRREMVGQTKQLKELNEYIDISVVNTNDKVANLTADDVRELFFGSNNFSNLSKIEKYFVVPNHMKDDSNNYFVDQSLFLDYSMRLSVQLKSQILDVFQKYGWLEGLTKSDRVEALFDLIEIEQKD